MKDEATMSGDATRRPAKLSLLREIVASDIKREGSLASTMVRAGLLAEVIDYADRLQSELTQARENLERLAAAGRIVLDGLNERIDNACAGDALEVPVFRGIADLHTALSLLNTPAKDTGNAG